MSTGSSTAPCSVRGRSWAAWSRFLATACCSAGTSCRRWAAGMTRPDRRHRSVPAVSPRGLPDSLLRGGGGVGGGRAPAPRSDPATDPVVRGGDALPGGSPACDPVRPREFLQTPGHGELSVRRAHCDAEPAHDVPVWGDRRHRGRRALHPAAAKTHDLDLGAHHNRGVPGDAGGTARTGVGDRPCPRALRPVLAAPSRRRAAGDSPVRAQCHHRPHRLGEDRARRDPPPARTLTEVYLVYFVYLVYLVYLLCTIFSPWRSFETRKTRETRETVSS